MKFIRLKNEQILTILMLLWKRYKTTDMNKIFRLVENDKLKICLQDEDNCWSSKNI